jgi:two-component system sensor histidine kinase ChiS
MREMAAGKLDMRVDDRALREFHELADTFNRMADQVRMRTRDLERLLDLDDNAILCVDRDGEVVYYNRSATTLFGYPDDTLTDLDVSDLFVDRLPALLDAQLGAAGEHDKLHQVLTCRHQQGHEFKSDAVITPVDVLGQPGHAIAFNTAIGDDELLSQQSEQRLQAVEQSLTSLLQFAQHNPSLIPGIGSEQPTGKHAASDKALIREQAVSVMTLALACWEHELGKSKLDLAEQSGIWPVYIDKSTPTTRTLDKYLNLDSCPKNPRSKRVIDTAEFVLRMSPNTSSEACSRLHAALDAFRQLLSGIRSSSTQAVSPAKSASP